MLQRKIARKSTEAAGKIIVCHLIIEPYPTRHIFNLSVSNFIIYLNCVLYSIPLLAYRQGQR